MASPKASPLNRKGLVLWLTGFTVLYQVVYQIFMMRALQREATDEECHAGVSSSGSGPGASLRCAEVELFRTWQQHAIRTDVLGPEVDLYAKQTRQEDRGGQDAPQLHSPLQLPSESPLEAQRRALHERHLQQEEDLLLKVPASNLSDTQGALTLWAQEEAKLDELQLMVGDLKTSSTPKNQTPENLLNDSKPEFVNSSSAREEQRSGAQEDPAEWSRNFMRQVRSAQREMCEEPHRRNRSDCLDLLASIAEAERREAEEARLRIAARSASSSASFMREVQAAQKEMCREAHRRNRPDCVELLAAIARSDKLVAEEMKSKRAARAALRANISAEAAHWDLTFRRLWQTTPLLTGAAFRSNLTAEMARWEEAFQQEAEQSASSSFSFMLEVQAAQKEMCREAHRRYRPDCVELLAAIAQSEKQVAEEIKSKVSARAALRADISAEAAHWDSTFRTGRTSLRQGRRPLHWSDVAAWPAKGWLRGFSSNKGSLVVDRSELEAARWAGMIPKVACVTAIRSGPFAATRLKLLINRFRQQTYEGPSQLILVYHYGDAGAADLVRLYADGSYIKAVSSLDNGEFPSTIAMRFGAWSADDAQVIVQWNFEERHHPDLLSLQVRALAYSGRPGCLLRERSSGASFQETLAGEAKWMQKNWYPFLSKQQSAPQSLREDQIVHVSTAMDGPHEADPLLSGPDAQPAQ